MGKTEGRKKGKARKKSKKGEVEGRNEKDEKVAKRKVKMMRKGWLTCNGKR